MRICIIGLGCVGQAVIKALKNLKQKIELIQLVDFDLVEKCNLQQSLIYNVENLNQSKAEAISNFLAAKGFDKSSQIKIYKTKLESIEFEEFSETEIFFVCVDNLETWLFSNNLFFFLNKTQTLIDIGCQMLNAHIRIVRNENGACLQCSSQLYYQTKIPLSCQLNKIPQSYEQCIQLAEYLIREYNQKPSETDDQVDSTEGIDVFGLCQDWELTSEQQVLFQLTNQLARQHNIPLQDKNFFIKIFKQNNFAFGSTSLIIYGFLQQNLLSILEGQHPYNTIIISQEKIFNLE